MFVVKQEPQQLDMLRFEDNLAALRHHLRESVERIGLSHVAHLVGREPSTISHQLSGLDPSKRPSADLAFVCWLLDPVFRTRVAGVLGDELVRPSDLDAEEVVRLAHAQARVKGYIDVGDLGALLARMKKGGAA